MPDEKELQSLKRNPKVLEIYAQKVTLTKEDTNRWRGHCPFGDLHKNGVDRTPSFDVFKYPDGSFGYKCLGCGSSGNVFQFVSLQWKVEFNKAVDFVRKQLGGTWAEGADLVSETFHEPIPQQEKKYVMVPLSNYIQFTDSLRNSKEARAFLAGRKLDIDTACKMKMGFRQSLPESMKLGKSEDLRDAGWLLFPYIEGDKIIRVKARSIKQKFFTQMAGMEQRGLYNSEAADPLQPLFLVEGELDAAALTAAGFNAVSLYNATHAVTPADKDVLMASSELYLAGDMDGGVGEEKMKKLWSELQDHTYLLRWPEGIKDANDYLKSCKDLGEFKSGVEGLMQIAKSQPMPGIYSLQEAMLNSNRTDMINHPDRLRFPWKGVDEMAICLPGSVIALTASSTGMGKTQFLMNATVSAARRRKEVILNYQAEMSPDEIANMTAAHLLQKDRNELTNDDYKEAARRLDGVRYYVGCNPDLQNSTQVLDLIEHAVRRLSPTIVVLDHLHHICRNVKDEIQDQANAMKRIKNMARKYGLKFIVVGQPRKSNQQGRGKEIYMSDMKGSETIASDSDVVFILHRDYLKDFDPAHPPMDVFGPETKVTLHKGRTKGKGAAACNLILRGTIATFVEEAEVANNLQEESETFSKESSLFL